MATERGRVSDAFVERRFLSPLGEVLAKFEKPFLASGGEYRCRWRLIWPDRERSQETAGIDGVQALMLALRTVHSELMRTDDYQGGKLTYLDQTDLDLPPTWGDGPLYDAGRPTSRPDGS